MLQSHLSRFWHQHPELSTQSAIAVGLSGGADSTALCHSLSVFSAAQPHPFAIHALIIDHQLRPESAAEAQQVAQNAAQWANVHPQILRWQMDTKPTSRVQEQARAARYALLQAACAELGVDYLFLGHHADDQLETLLLRLSAGSGPDGLRGMLPLHAVDAIYRARPLLAAAHADLVSYCQQHGLEWVEDPSNANRAYGRIRMRAARDILTAEGLTAQRAAQVTRRLQDSVAALDWMADQHAHLCAKTTPDTHTYALSTLKELPFALQLRLVRRSMTTLAPERPYPARLDALEDQLAALLSTAAYTQATLGGMLFTVSPARDTLQIRPENRN